MANNVDMFQLHENHVEVTHQQFWNNALCGVTTSTISYPTFLNILEEARGREITITNPVELYIQLINAFRLDGITFPKHLARLEYIPNRGVYITQIYGGSGQHIFSEIKSDTSRIAVRYFVSLQRELDVASVQVSRYTGVFAGAVNQSDLTPLPVLTEAFQQILGENRIVPSLCVADMSMLVKKLPARGRVSTVVRRVVNEAKNTDTAIRWEDLA